jgi:hypothetical protein
MADLRLEKWRRWIDGQIKDEVLTMHLHHDTWLAVQEVVSANGTRRTPTGRSS